ncbi:DUF4177 domain-containing protein [Falsihalocynthiibacter sp. SS001]|uniref:DUF4177 domain-containing protein n=1 Tax=Falsihalocynthiibacter sp. SS001 TaxID=3349698 RepID=UPI0036D2BE0A
MPIYEYKVVPAPQKGLKARTAKTTSARFAHALATLMNEMGRDGWEYQRAETLPCEERSALGSKSTHYQNVLVFRRALNEESKSVRKLEDASETPVRKSELSASKNVSAEASSAPRISPFGNRSTPDEAPEKETLKLVETPAESTESKD